MGYPPKAVASILDAPITVTADDLTIEQAGKKSVWTNYTITAQSSFEFVVQANSSGAKLNDFHLGPCSQQTTHGLCQVCSTQLFAQGFECTTAGIVKQCKFGISAAGSKNDTVAILVAWGEGAQVSYISLNLAAYA